MQNTKVRVCITCATFLILFFTSLGTAHAHHSHQHRFLILGQVTEVKFDFVGCEDREQTQEVIQADINSGTYAGGDAVFQKYATPTAIYGDKICGPIKGYVLPLRVVTISGYGQSTEVQGNEGVQAERIIEVRLIKAPETPGTENYGDLSDIIKFYESLRSQSLLEARLISTQRPFFIVWPGGLMQPS